MKLQIIAVRDIQANVYGQPNFVASIGGAIRSFADEINRPAQDNVLYQHPEDFEMYHLGEFNDANAEFELLTTPVQIATGKNLKRA